jgi:hypothetical protein
MTDSDDKLSRRYRGLPRAEPSAELDAAILAASRRAVGAGPRSRSSWMVPTSIAAVLVLGIGVSLRMQLEQPGIETSAPERAERPAASSPAQAPQPSPAPPASSAPEAPAAQSLPAPTDLARTEPAPREERARGPAPERKATAPLAKERNAALEPPPPAVARTDSAEVKPLADAPVAKEAASASGPAIAMAPAPAAPPAPLAAPAQSPAPSPPPSSTSPATTAAPQAAPAPRAKREAFAADSATRESRALGAVADPDPARELERIARLREAARHEEADRALAEFRRRHPDYRIPEAMWERVKPR